jgi:DNA-binding phage protein
MILKKITKWYSNELILQFMRNQLNKIMYTAKIIDQLNVIMTTGNIIEMAQMSRDSKIWKKSMYKYLK